MSDPPKKRTKPNALTRFPIVRKPSGSRRLSKLYADILDVGFGDEVPLNFFTAQGSRPDLLEATWALTKTLLKSGRIDERLTQLILVTVSIQNDNKYCTMACSLALESLGVPGHAIARSLKDLDSNEIPEMERVVLKFASKAAASPRSLAEEDFWRLRNHGYDDGAIMEIVMIAGFANFINGWADASAVPVDRILTPLEDNSGSE